MLTTIIGNFNHARFLPESLGSILRQTRPADELIVIDDVSTDNSVEIISSLLQRHPNARLIRNSINQGSVANNNDGLRLAQGTFVHLGAADDVYYPTFYEEGIRLLESYQGVAIVSARSDIIDEHGRNLHMPTPPAGYPLRRPGFIAPVDVQHLLMREDGWFMGNAAIFRRSYVLDEGGLREEMQSFADGYMCRILALKYGACFSPEILAAWRRLEGGFSASVNANEKKFQALIANAGQRMISDRVFPAGYAKRWIGRQEFEMHRRALARVYMDRGTASLISRVVEKMRAVSLLIRYRPWDLVVSIRHYVNHALGRTKN